MLNRVAVRAWGFTLIELMVTIAIMALMLLAVAPSLASWVVNLHIRNTASGLEQGLQRARQEAIRRNQGIGFWLVSASTNNDQVLDGSCQLSNTSGSWVVSVKTPAGNCAASPSVSTDPMLVASHAVGDGGTNVSVLAVDSSGAAANSVVFNGTGTIANASPISKIDVTATSNASNYRSLCLELTGIGAVRLCDPALDSTDPRACKSACKQ
jgi:type IV fimbrial biogenesis protein FimT